MSEETAVVVTYEINGKVYLKMQEEKRGGPIAICGWRTETEAVRHFEDGYNRYHARSYEASMSACINWMMINPKVHTTTLSHIERLLQGTKQLFTLSGLGYIGIQGLLLPPSDDLTQFRAEGIEPRLISR